MNPHNQRRGEVTIAVVSAVLWLASIVIWTQIIIITIP